jgi:hypothetical protein
MKVKKIILLNGFIKRTNKDYIKALKVAEYLLTEYDNELD